jgi:hypothetical protein
MAKIGGWEIWAEETGTGKVRQFTVAKPLEAEAIAAVEARFPVRVVSRHTHDQSTIRDLNLTGDRYIEWIQADPNDVITPMGVPIGTPMQ